LRGGDYGSARVGGDGAGGDGAGDDGGPCDDSDDRGRDGNSHEDGDGSSLSGTLRDTPGTATPPKPRIPLYQPPFIWSVWPNGHTSFFFPSM
jgi:hypothetical protein